MLEAQIKLRFSLIFPGQPMCTRGPILRSFLYQFRRALFLGNGCSQGRNLTGTLTTRNTCRECAGFDVLPATSGNSRPRKERGLELVELVSNELAYLMRHQFPNKCSGHSG